MDTNHSSMACPNEMKWFYKNEMCVIFKKENIKLFPMESLLVVLAMTGVKNVYYELLALKVYMFPRVYVP